MKKRGLLLISAGIFANIRGPVLADDPRPVHAGTRILRGGNLIMDVGAPGSPDSRWNKDLRFSPVANITQTKLNGREFCYAPIQESPGAIPAFRRRTCIGLRFIPLNPFESITAQGRSPRVMLNTRYLTDKSIKPSFS